MAGESRKKNTFYNFFIPTLFMIGTVFLKFFEVRLFLSVLGDEINGLQSTAGQVLAYLNIIELGVGSAFIFHFYKPLAERDTLRICAVFNGAKIIMRRIGYVFVTLLITAAFLYPFLIKDVRSGQFPFILPFLTILLLGLSSIYGYFISAPESLFLTANQKGYIQRILGIFSSLGIPLVSIIIFYSVRFFPETDKNFLYIVILCCKAGISFLSSLITVTYVRRHYPFLYRHKEEKDTSIFGMTKDLLPHKIADLLVFNTIPILLSFFSTLKTVSVYSVYYLLIGYVSIIAGLMLRAPQNSLGNLLNENKERFSLIYKKYENFSFILITCFTILLLFGFYPFMQWYLHDKPDYSIISLMVLFSAHYYFRSIRIPFTILIDITGNYKKTKYIAVIEAVVIFTFSIVGLLIFKTPDKQLLTVSTAPVVSFLTYDLLQMFTVNKIVLGRSPFVLIFKWGCSVLVLLIAAGVFFQALPVLKTIQWNFLNLALYACLLLIGAFLPITFGYLYFKRKIKKRRTVC